MFFRLTPGQLFSGKDKKMVYIVSINYTDYEFMDGNTALSFGELALRNCKDNITVTIKLKRVPLFEDKEEDDDF